MPESFSSRLLRWKLNWFPAYRGTGARITYIADNFREVRIQVPLNWRTRNYVGSIFGGSMFGAVDPILMVMFIHLLGRDYIVWDRSATIEFKAPGRTTLDARFAIAEEELAEIRAVLEREPKLEHLYRTDLIDAEGKVCAVVEQTIYFRKKRPRGAESR